MNGLKLYALGAGLIAVFCVMFLTQRSCDRAGEWPHREDTRVYTGIDSWPEGEMRKCLALPRKDGTIYFLGCVEGYENFTDAHHMPVTFWGRTERPDRFRALHSNSFEAWEWRCKNNSGSLTCYAVN